ncbi:helix-turn-helix transcriptional regulator [Streptomyces sp. NPDC001588]
MVNAAPEGETLKEIAARHGRAYNTVRAHWSRHPDWPAHIDKRGREKVYDSAAVDAVIAQHFARTTTELEARRLYTAREIEDVTGVTAATIRADRSKGRWPAPDDTQGRSHVWYGATVAKALEGRRSYRKDAT